MGRELLLVCLLGVLILAAGAAKPKLRKDTKLVKKGKLTGDIFIKTKRQTSCTSTQFACSDRCIPDTYVCDTERDCSAGEDEQNCPPDCSHPNAFKCTNGNCIPAIYKCDTDNDCGDNSDEGTQCNHGSTCASYQFLCANGNCVSQNWICDGDNDCGDQSDEQNCQNQTCSSIQFTCTNKRCIPQAYQCDNDNDCGDHSDEISCSCDSNHFHCPNAGCIPLSYKCDGDNDCGDMSDETNCADLHPGACVDLMTYDDCIRMNTATFPICDYYADGHKYCRKYCGLCNT